MSNTIITLTEAQLDDFLKNTNHEYRTTHRVLCFAIIQRIHRRLLMGYRFGAIKISKEKIIVDGNHRFIAHQLAGIDIVEVLGGTCFCDTENHIKNINDIDIDLKEDWDKNCFKNKKYCNDDFLVNCERVEL